MIPQEILYVLILVDAGLCIYPFTDLENRVYSNIIAGIFASLLSFFIAVNAITGNVFLWDAVVSTTNATVVNNTTTTVYTYSDSTLAIQSPPLMWFFAILGVVMMVMTIYMVVEAVAGKEEGEMIV